MIKTTKLYLLLIAFVASFSSCLDKYPDDAIPADKAINTIQEADEAIFGIYAAFKNSALYSGYLTLLPDLQADLAYAVNGYSNTYGDIWRWDILATNNEITAVYGSLYELIARANFFLEYEPRVRENLIHDKDFDKLDTYNGEAYLARALAYSELIKLFTVAYESDEQAENALGVVLMDRYYHEGPIKRATLKESYEFVLSDLDKAAKFLELGEDYFPAINANLYNTPYFNEYVAHALRARVALYMKDYEEAIKYSSKVIDSQYYALSSVNTKYSNDQNMYDYMWTSDNSTEIIWKVGFTMTSYGGALGRVFLNFDYRSFKPDYVPANWVINLYEDSDKRGPAFFTTVTTGYSHKLTWPLLTKYMGNEAFFNNQILHVSMPKVFRLSEQYLIRAEAYAMSDKPSFAAASKDISTLRDARYTTSGKISVDPNDPLKVIERERVKELYMEGFRLNDLKRWNKGFTRQPQSQSLQNGSSLRVDKDNPLFVWPIPQHELESPDADIEGNESNK